MYHICPNLIKLAVSEDFDIQATIQLLKIAKRLKIKKFGLNTYNDPDLIKIHNGWPFKAFGSIFSIKQEIQRCWKRSATSVLIDELKSEHENYKGGNCGNYMQHELPRWVNDKNLIDKNLIYVTGIYTLSDNKQYYDFVFIPKENAEIKNT